MTRRAKTEIPPAVFTNHNIVWIHLWFSIRIHYIISTVCDSCISAWLSAAVIFVSVEINARSCIYKAKCHCNCISNTHLNMAFGLQTSSQNIHVICNETLYKWIQYLFTQLLIHLRISCLQMILWYIGELGNQVVINSNVGCTNRDTCQIVHLQACL